MTITENQDRDEVVISAPVFAPYAQQGSKLVGTGYIGNSMQGVVAVSADGNTAVVGGSNDNMGTGALWVFTRTSGVWSQQGNKLTGSDCVGASGLGTSVAISADGNTVIAGGSGDNNSIGAAWIFTRSNGAWSQQGNKIVGSNYVLSSMQGASVGMSADGNTVAIGGNGDGGAVGAVWIFNRSERVWSQVGNKLVGTGFEGKANQGSSLALSADGKTLIVGSVLETTVSAPIWVFVNSSGWQQQGNYLTASGAIVDKYGQNTTVSVSADGNSFVLGENQDNDQTGAFWIFTRTDGTWSQQSGKLVGSGASGKAAQGCSVSMSDDGQTVVVGGDTDNGNQGAVWVFQNNGGAWLQCGEKLVGTNAGGAAYQGNSVALSGDGRTILSGGFNDDSLVGASWVFAAQFIH
ncbi:MAG: hypothetical protein K5905_15400 [Roseibium sp.]|uniref:WD40 repeat domain-containing protein n=1 Tax=Roseibium sp. TaxID=1936156 RepID=UPI0026074621|nr:hypothetical protein [Roseibium sp.]MCV0426845.1 hypothetical protein [Roseibium sp.]